MALLAGGCAALVLLLAGCAVDVPVKESTGTLYEFYCDQQDSYFSLVGLNAQLPTKTVNPATADCPFILDRVLPAHSTGTASTGPPLQYMLDAAILGVQALDPTTFTFRGMHLPGGGNAAYPVSMDMTPDGSSIWVLQIAIQPNSNGITPQPAQISILNLASQTYTGTIALPNNISADTIRFSPDGATAYISNNGAPFNNETGIPANSSVLVLDVASQTVVKTIPTPKGAGFEVMSPDGMELYTINNNLGIGANTLTAIDTTTNTAGATAFLSGGAIKMFINPTGTRLYIYQELGIVVFDTATLQQIASIKTVGFSMQNNFAVFTPDGGTAWFCNCGYGIYYQVDVRTNQVVTTTQTQDLGHGFMFGAF
jgi:DNA-binding beta-propeller fold protein YncE